MKTIFTKKEIIANKGCYSLEKTNKLSFINNKEISIKDVLTSEISIKDKRWFVYNACELTLKEKKDLCLKLAWCVLPIYENKHKDDRVRECLEAIELYNNSKITIEELKVKRTADDAAAYAAYADAAAAYAAAAAAAAYAADAAAYAADAAAAYAADAAAYAADAAAAYAADAAAYAADAKISYSKQIETILIDFVK